uniref:Protein SMG7 n=1 Tax=Gongylonema pulchrum TaxID=637853 RepID=A0A183DLA4_9BILA
LHESLPQAALMDGVPAVPGVIGSLPGAGGCLPHRTPLVNQRSPSLFQNFLRYIPGAQDYLSSLVKTPNIDLHSLLGKYYWVRVFEIFLVIFHRGILHLKSPPLNTQIDPEKRGLFAL